ncbi:ABC transporter related [Catenulispora acidiphila DSM 44928]|uniref:ABC transporter related n=1 Tax=Catenulispora acidiphila (strain DSM 44928 / JCM 14897 / NBRC 102108 / NRRL B-24433 / ID139908) TaxID=479433 RepID=C7QDR5_CATAD|nr:ABC transporter ATP-binding protein [Catenulispora acidiphila]ACU74689.1 ABC transporter related [Catenulispora acidiphila DSM 44928]
MSTRAAPAALALSWRAAPLASVASLAVTLALGVLPATTAWTSKLLLDELARGHTVRVGRASWLVAAGAALAAAMTILTLVSTQLSRRVQRAITLRTQDQLYERVNAIAGLRSFEDPVFQDRLRLAEQGAQGAPGAITKLLTETVRNAIVILGYLGTLMVLWPPMAGFLALAAVPAFLAQRELARRRAGTTEKMMETARKRYFYQALLTDAASAKEVRLFGLGGFFHGRLLAMLRATTDADLAVEAYAARVQGLLGLLTAAVAAVAGIVVVHGIADGRVSLGGFMLFTVAVGGVQSAVSAITTQASTSGQYLRLFRSWRDLVDAPADLPSGTTPAPALRHGVELRDVWFRYQDDGPWVLRGVNLLIPAGQAVGLVGLNGAGKSTLVKLLCRFYAPERGQILWDGVDVAEFDIASLRRRIGATFQDFCRYDATAAENVGLGDLDRIGDLAAIRQAAADAGIDAKLAGLRDGYATFLSRVFRDAELKAGTALSGGQWQRVAIARSLMRRDADLLILDEPGSGLDPEAEHEVHLALSRHRAGRTSLLISHRLSTLRDADLIVVLREGRVVEQGGHTELMAAQTDYARLFLTQAAGYRDTPEPVSAPSPSPTSEPPSEPRSEPTPDPEPFHAAIGSAS